MIYVGLTFVVVLAVILAAYYFFILVPEDREALALRKRLRPSRPAPAATRSPLRKQTRALSAVGALDAALKRRESVTRGPQLLIEQSGANVTVGTLLLACGVLALLAYILVQRGIAALDVPYLVGFTIGLLAAFCSGFVPVAVLRLMRTRRLRKFEEQFPEALDLMSRALRAGHAFNTGIEMVADELPKPVGPEFRLLHDQQNYGMPMPDALKVFAERVPLLDARFFVTAVLIQRESGGNLAEVLDNLTKVIRERFRVKRQIRVVSAHGRITGWVLVGLPPALFVLLNAVNADHRETMFGNTLGIQMIVGALVLQVVGTLIIRKIVNVEY